MGTATIEREHWTVPALAAERYKGRVAESSVRRAIDRLGLGVRIARARVVRPDELGRLDDALRATAAADRRRAAK